MFLLLQSNRIRTVLFLSWPSGPVNDVGNPGNIWQSLFRITEQTPPRRGACKLLHNELLSFQGLACQNSVL